MGKSCLWPNPYMIFPAHTKGGPAYVYIFILTKVPQIIVPTLTIKRPNCRYTPTVAKNHNAIPHSQLKGLLLWQNSQRYTSNTHNTFPFSFQFPTFSDFLLFLISIIFLQISYLFQFPTYYNFLLFQISYFFKFPTFSIFLHFPISYF